MIDIIKHVRTFLLQDTALVALIGEKIYPVTIKQTSADSTSFDNLPQIVIERNLSITTNRDYRQYGVTIELSIITANYSDNVAIAELIDGKLMTIEGYEGIRGVELQAVNETYIANAFIQKLTYSISN